MPGELGFYDLRLPEVRALQAELARAHNIDGFCYYHYWFNGKRLLNRPTDDILTSRQPNFPFCLAWANENWTRAWDGRDREVLMQQNYNAADDVKHIRHLLPFFADSRYVRIGGRPLFIIYKIEQLPDPKRTLDCWRGIAMQEGIGDLCLAQFESGGAGTARDPRTLGLDLSIEFTPDWRNLAGTYYSTRKAKLAMKFGLISKVYSQHKFYDYRRMATAAMTKVRPEYPFIRCVSPGFDSSSRRPNNATVLLNSTPENYENWLTKALEWTTGNRPEHQVLFINA